MRNGFGQLLEELDFSGFLEINDHLLQDFSQPINGNNLSQQVPVLCGQTYEKGQTDKAGCMLMQVRENLLDNVLQNWGVILDEFGQHVEGQQQTFFGCCAVVQMLVVKEVACLAGTRQQAGGHCLRCRQ